MDFYVARIKFKNGEVSPTHTVFADTASDALKSFQDHAGDADQIEDLLVELRPNSDALFFGRDPRTTSNEVQTHPDVQWMP